MPATGREPHSTAWPGLARSPSNGLGVAGDDCWREIAVALRWRPSRRLALALRGKPKAGDSISRVHRDGWSVEHVVHRAARRTCGGSLPAASRRRGCLPGNRPHGPARGRSSLSATTSQAAVLSGSALTLGPGQPGQLVAPVFRAALVSIVDSAQPYCCPDLLALPCSGAWWRSSEWVCCQGVVKGWWGAAPGG